MLYKCLMRAITMGAMDIDDLVNDANEREAKHRDANEDEADRDIDSLTDDISATVVKGKRQRIGTVEHFFSKVSVVAIKLDADLMVGDYIEIDTGNGTVAEMVSSMQIEKESITEAHAGDSVGIKLSRAVPPGSEVYKGESPSEY